MTAEDGTTVKVYKVIVTRAEAPDAGDSTLSSYSLTDSNGSDVLLWTSFSPDNRLYYASVPNDVTSVTATATPNDSGATLLFEDGTSTGTVGQVTRELEVGSNRVKVRVTSQDGDSRKIYAIMVTRAGTGASTDATLSDLTLEDNDGNSIPISPAPFNSSTTEYTASVANSVSSVTVQTETTDSGAIALIFDEDGTHSSDYKTISLSVGDNAIRVSVYAEDASTEKTYNLTVTRATSTDSADSTLSSLTLATTGGTTLALTPAFDPATTSYTASVGNATTAVTLSATKNHSGASATIIDSNGTITPNSATVGLNVGANVVRVEVTSEDGNNTTTYTVTGTRAASTDATLRSLSLTDNGGSAIALTPTFDPATGQYQASVANSVGSLTVTAVENHSGAEAVFVGAVETGTPGEATQALVVGENLVKVMVTAQDNTTVKIYMVTVTRAASTDSTLSSLTLVDDSSTAISISPTFDAATTAYTASVGNTTGTITVSASANHGGASVNIVAPDDTSTPDTATVALDVGENTVKAVVTAEDGVTSTEYVVKITRAASTDATLGSLSLTDNGTAISLAPSFDAATTSYTASVGNATGTVTVSGSASHRGASVNIVAPDDTSTPDTATVALDVGENTVKAVVTAEDGVTTGTYTITITRESAEVWTATLSVGKDDSIVPAGYGYSLWGSSIDGTLVPDRFTIEGVRYRAMLLVYLGDGLFLALNRHLPSDFTLKVGDVEYDGHDSSIPVTHGRARYWWSDGQVNLTKGQTVAVSLSLKQSSLPQLGAAPPTGYFSHVPDSHNGIDTFTFETDFTDAVSIDAATLKEHSFDVTGGSVVEATQLSEGSTRSWEIEVQPDSGSDVTITLIDPSDCNVTGAICTSDGRLLHNQPSVTVTGPDSSGSRTTD